MSDRFQNLWVISQREIPKNNNSNWKEKENTRENLHFEKSNRTLSIKKEIFGSILPVNNSYFDLIWKEVFTISSYIQKKSKSNDNETNIKTNKRKKWKQFGEKYIQKFNPFNFNASEFFSLELLRYQWIQSTFVCRQTNANNKKKRKFIIEKCCLILNIIKKNISIEEEQQKNKKKKWEKKRDERF